MTNSNIKTFNIYGIFDYTCLPIRLLYIGLTSQKLTSRLQNHINLHSSNNILLYLYIQKYKNHDIKIMPLITNINDIIFAKQLECMTIKQYQHLYRLFNLQHNDIYNDNLSIILKQDFNLTIEQFYNLNLVNNLPHQSIQLKDQQVYKIIIIYYKGTPCYVTHIKQKSQFMVSLYRIYSTASHLSEYIKTMGKENFYIKTIYTTLDKFEAELLQDYLYVFLNKKYTMYNSVQFKPANSQLFTYNFNQGLQPFQSQITYKDCPIVCVSTGTIFPNCLTANKIANISGTIKPARSYTKHGILDNGRRLFWTKFKNIDKRSMNNFIIKLDKIDNIGKMLLQII